MKFDTRDLEKYISDFGLNAMSLTPSEKSRLLKCCADAVTVRMKENIPKMLKGPYYVGDVLKSVYLDGKHINERDPYYLINFRGTVSHKSDKGKRVRAAEVAFLNEYGVPTKERQKKPRPFIKEAIYDGIADCEDEIQDILADIVAKKLIK